MDSKSLDDSLFLAKRSINDFFRELFEENRGFKYILSTRVTLKNGITQLILMILIQFIVILIQ